jgi:hypothetical protein
MHFLFCLALLLFPQSQPPVPTPSKTSHIKQAETSGKKPKSAPNENPTDELTDAVNKLAANVAAQNQQSSTSKQNYKTSSDWWLKLNTGVVTLATLALAILAFCQWRAMHRQAEYMRNGLRVSIRATRISRQSAIAAKASADSLKSIERPWLLIESFDYTFGPFQQEDGERRNAYYSVWRFRNYGKTPARILDVGGDLIDIRHIGELPPTPAYRKAPHYTDYGILAPDAKSDLVEVPAHGSITEQQSRLKLVVMGFVRYADPWDEEHETRFCYVRDQFTGNNDMIGPPSYNQHT